MSFKILKDQVVNVLNMTYVGIFRREGIKQSVSDTDYTWFVVVYLSVGITSDISCFGLIILLNSTLVLGLLFSS